MNPPPETTTNPGAQSPDSRAKPIRIVLVDDHRIFRESLQCLLGQQPDFDVVGLAASSQDAYACVGKTAPDVVISDLHRPGDDGLIATRKIRRANPQIKILILTGDPSTTVVRDALVAGAHGFMRKTDACTCLVKGVREVVSGEIFLRPFPATMGSEEPVTAAAASGKFALTKRELEVLRRLSDGLSYKGIADQLHVSVKSVDYYRAALVKKTGCATRAQLVRYAVRMGIVAA